MVYFKKAIEQFVLWIVCVFLFIGILFLPGTTEYETGRGGQFVSASYDYDLDRHVKNITGFFCLHKRKSRVRRVCPRSVLRGSDWGQGVEKFAPDCSDFDSGLYFWCVEGDF